MYLKFSLVLVLCISSLCALNTLCSKNVQDNKCLCKEFTDEDTNLPVIEAKCILMSLSEFPDLSQLPEDLTKLDLSFNNIQTLEASNGTSSSTIEILILTANEITDVKANFFDGLPALMWLDLSHNHLTSLSNEDKDGHVFRHLKNLVILDLSYNNFKELPDGLFLLLPLLKYLDLGYNPLGEFLTRSSDVLSRTLRIVPRIAHLSLKNVGLKNISQFFFYPYQNLNTLELQDNSFEYIPTLPTTLRSLDLSGNKLSFVSASYLKFPLLKVLILGRMPSLTSIHPYAFSNLRSLATLILTDCPNVREFSDLAFGVPSESMASHLTILNLARNGITSLNSTYAPMFRRLFLIDLTHNPWDCDCDILWLQDFALELYKDREISCTTPEHLKGQEVLNLKRIDFPNCDTEKPSTRNKLHHPKTDGVDEAGEVDVANGGRSYTMLIIGVVLLLVGIFASIMFYRSRYQKSRGSPRQIGVIPDSP